MSARTRRIGAICGHMTLGGVTTMPVATGRQVKVGIIGVGGMGMGHYKNITGGDVPAATVCTAPYAYAYPSVPALA